MIVIDASALVKALVEKSDSGEAVRERLRGESLSAPAHLDAEVLSVLRGLARSGKLPAARAQTALETVSRMPLARAPLAPHLDRSWQLRGNYSAYDALYLALAEGLQCPLVTSDRRLAEAPGAQCVIEVFD